MKRLFLYSFTAIILIACNNGQTARKLTPEAFKNIETTAQQEMLFEHYENVNTVHGGSYEGCCVFDENRIALANYAVAVYEKKTGHKFTNKNMLIGSSESSLMIHIVPKNTSLTSNHRSFFIEISKASGELVAFREMVE